MDDGSCTFQVDDLAQGERLFLMDLRLHLSAPVWAGLQTYMLIHQH